MDGRLLRSLKRRCINLYGVKGLKRFTEELSTPREGGGGGLSYKKGGDARRQIAIEPLKGTNLGVA